MCGARFTLKKDVKRHVKRRHAKGGVEEGQGGEEVAECAG